METTGRHETEYVCGALRVPLTQLARGSTHVRIDGHLQPRSTVRGAAGLDWRTRPGVYMQAQSRVVATLRCASVAIPEQ